MAVATTTGRDVLIHLHDLSDPNLELDLTSDVWTLKDGQVSNLIGLDVVNPGRFRPEKGRISADVSSPSGTITRGFPGLDFASVEQRLTYRLYNPTAAGAARYVHDGVDGDGADETASYTNPTITSNSHGVTVNHTDDRVGVFKPDTDQGIFAVDSIPGANTITIGAGADTIPTGGPTNWTIWRYLTHRDGVILLTDTTVSPNVQYLVKMPKTYTAEGAWDSEIVGAEVIFNEDDRILEEQSRSVTARAEVFQSNDALQLSSPGVREDADDSIVTIEYEKDGDLRGIWVTNGQKFWILQNGTFNLKLDLSDVASTSDTWRMTRLAEDRVIFTSPAHPPHVVKLDAATVTTTNTFETLAGCLPPRKDEGVEKSTLKGSNLPSWGMRGTTTGFLTDTEVYRVQVRAVNLDENLESEFVDVYPEEENSASSLTIDGTTKDLTLASQTAIDIFTVEDGSHGNFVGTPHPRWTHIEVWRVVGGTTPGTTYYLESRIALGVTDRDTDAPGFMSQTGSTSNPGIVKRGTANNNNWPVVVADSEITAFTAKDANDIASGRLPPVCKEVAVIDNTAFYFGKADASPNNPTVYYYGYTSVSGDSSAGDFWDDTDDPFVGYRYKSGDELVVYDGGIDANGDEGRTGTYTIEGISAASIPSASKHAVAPTANDSGSPTEVGHIVRDGSYENADAVEVNNTNSVLKVEFNDVTILNLTSDPTSYTLVVTATETSAGGNGVLRMVPYNGTNTVTTVGAIDFTITSDTKEVNEFDITQAFADELVAQTNSNFAVRFYSNTASRTMDIHEVYLQRVDRLEMVTDFQTAPEFGNVTTDYRKPRAVIRRPRTWIWPKVDSDEEFRYSRTDKASLESITTTVRTLSRRGDTFRRALAVGNYIAVVMDQGVHLVYKDSSNNVQIDTVASTGEGTPWADSVVVVGRVVVWATPQGAKVLKASNDANIEGERGVIAPLGGERFRQWFTDAFTNDEDIDAGADLFNGCIRFRRPRAVSGKGTNYQVLQYSFRTDKWTLLDDDAGVSYASGLNAVASPPSGERLYTITAEGNLFEVNRSDGTNHPYASETVQDTLDGTYTIADTSITKTGIFSTAMLGDVIRIESSDSGRNGQIRTITSATANSVGFSAVTGLASGDTFKIGAIRFLVKYAPFRGRLKHTVKTLRDIKVVSEEGFKGTPTGSFTVNTYEDYNSTAADTDTVTIHDHDATGKQSVDRFANNEAQGVAIELELVVDDTRTDFAIQQIETMVEEESDEITDGDTA